MNHLSKNMCACEDACQIIIVEKPFRMSSFKYLEKSTWNIVMSLKKAKYYFVILDCALWKNVLYINVCWWIWRTDIYIREHLIGYKNVDESSREVLFYLLKYFIRTKCGHAGDHIISTFVFKHTFASTNTSRLEFSW